MITQQRLDDLKNRLQQNIGSKDSILYELILLVEELVTTTPQPVKAEDEIQHDDDWNPPRDNAQ